MLLRIFTAILLIGLSGGILTQFPHWVFLFYVEMLLVIALYEWFRLGKQPEFFEGGGLSLFIALTLPILVVIVGFVTPNNRHKIEVYGHILLILSLVFWLAIVPLLLRQKTKIAHGLRGLTLGAFMLGTTFIAVHLLLHHSVMGLLAALSIPIVADIFAYLGGRLIGKRQLTLISPKKTIEGVIIGLIFATFLGGYFLSKIYGFPWGIVYVIALLGAIASVLGDLLESLAKRWAGVKDSGKILPGHGGLLDRFDSHFAALPVIAASVYLFRLIF